MASIPFCQLDTAPAIPRRVAPSITSPTTGLPINLSALLTAPILPRAASAATLVVKLVTYFVAAGATFFIAALETRSGTDLADTALATPLNGPIGNRYPA